MSVSFDAKVTIGGVIDALRRVEKLPTAKVFRNAKPDLRKELREHGANQEGPSGRWPSLASTTVERRARGKGRRRKLLGRMPGIFKIDSNRERIRATSPVKWSRVHDEGGRGGKGARIPERRFVWVSRRFNMRLRDRFRDALWRAWIGKGL